MRLSKITSTRPSTLTKTLTLNDKFDIESTSIAQMSSGHAHIIELSDINDLADLLESLKPNEALCFGIPKQNSIKVLSKDQFQKQGCPANAITRTKDCFYWPEGSGILMLDYDPPKGKVAFSREKLLSIIFETAPDLKESAYIYWCSSSSKIYNSETNSELKGVRGQRIYIPVKNAGDIPRAGKALANRLWLYGHGYYEVGNAGQQLERCLIDTSVWQTNRLDFAAGANCLPPLEQRRGKPLISDAQLFDSELSLPDLTKDEQKLLKQLKDNAKGENEFEADAVRKAYVDSRAQEIAGEAADNDKLEAAKTTILRALENDILTGDFKIILEDGSHKDIATILDNPEKYHLMQTQDPIEPEYNNGKIVGKLYLIGSRPNLHSFAHGGKNYKLIRQPRRIELVKGRTHDAVRETIELLRALPDTFDYGESMATVENGKLIVFNETLLIHWLGGVIQYWKWRRTPQGLFVEELDDPKRVIAQPILDMKRNFKPLDAVITAPIITPSGKIISKSGYHKECRIFLDTPEMIPFINERPSIKEVQQAIETIMEPFKDFPYASVLDKSVMLSGLLSACLRPILSTCPAHAYDAPIQGSGKTLLAECTAALSTGELSELWPPTSGRDDEEIRKRLFTALKTGKRAIVWDNILGVFDSASMAAFLTSSHYTDRVLGESKAITIPNKALLLITGNNLSLAGDMPRRVLVCRIDPKTAEPYKREFDVCPRSYVLANRQKLVAACLTVIRGWLTSDDYKNGIKAKGRMASFETWDDLVRQPIAWLSRKVLTGQFSDVMEAIDSAQQSDPEQEILFELLDALRDRYGNNYFAAKDLINVFDTSLERITSALQELAPHSKTDNARSVGKILKYRRERVVRSLRLESRQLKDNHQFRVVRVGTERFKLEQPFSNEMEGRALN